MLFGVVCAMSSDTSAKVQKIGDCIACAARAVLLDPNLHRCHDNDDDDEDDDDDDDIEDDVIATRTTATTTTTTTTMMTTTTTSTTTRMMMIFLRARHLLAI